MKANKYLDKIIAAEKSKKEGFFSKIWEKFKNNSFFYVFKESNIFKLKFSTILKKFFITLLLPIIYCYFRALNIHMPVYFKRKGWEAAPPGANYNLLQFGSVGITPLLACSFAINIGFLIYDKLIKKNIENDPVKENAKKKMINISSAIAAALNAAYYSIFCIKKAENIPSYYPSYSLSYGIIFRIYVFCALFAFFAFSVFLVNIANKFGGLCSCESMIFICGEIINYLNLYSDKNNKMGILKFLSCFIFICFIFILTTLLENIEDKIKINYVSRDKNSLMYGNLQNSTYIPINFNSMNSGVTVNILRFLSLFGGFFSRHAMLHNIIFALALSLMYFANYMFKYDAKTLSEYMTYNGGFIDGIRPGEETRKYINKKLLICSCIDSACMFFISFIIPALFSKVFKIDYLNFSLVNMAISFFAICKDIEKSISNEAKIKNAIIDTRKKLCKEDNTLIPQDPILNINTSNNNTEIKLNRAQKRKLGIN